MHHVLWQHGVATKWSTGGFTLHERTYEILGLDLLSEAGRRAYDCVAAVMPKPRAPGATGRDAAGCRNRSLHQIVFKHARLLWGDLQDRSRRGRFSRPLRSPPAPSKNQAGNSTSRRSAEAFFTATDDFDLNGILQRHPRALSSNTSASDLIIESWWVRKFGTPHRSCRLVARKNLGRHCATRPHGRSCESL